MIRAFKEKQFAKRVSRRLLKSLSVISGKKPEMTGKALYKEALLHSRQADSSNVDLVLEQAENSIDLWTTSTVEGLKFRHVVHFVVMEQYREEGHAGSVVSFRDVVYELIPADL